jgi:hypothetical protein
MRRFNARAWASSAVGLGLIVAGLVCWTSPAVAANTGSVTFTQTDFTVNEDSGSVELDLQRTGDTSGAAFVHWYTAQPGRGADANAALPAIPNLDYAEVNTHHAKVIMFAPGQKGAKLIVPIVDHRMPAPTKYFQVKIFGAGHVGVPNVARIEITGYDPMAAIKNASDPLALDAPAALGYPVPATAGTGATGTGTSTTASPTTAALTLGEQQAMSHRFADANPLQGVRFYAPPLQHLTTLFSQPAANLFLERPGNMRYRRALQPVWSVPQAMRYGTFDINDEGVDETATEVANYLENAQAQSPNTVPTLITYDLCHNSCRLPGSGHPTIIPEKGKCGQKAETTQQVNAFEGFVNQLAEGISDHRVVLFLEEDALITTKCLVPNSLPNRIKELRYAVDVLGALPRAAVYLDAGSGDAGITAGRMAHYLNQIGVDKIQGFFVNSTHSDWTLNEIRFGQKISRMTGGAHFVVDTETNGRGPEVPMQKVGHGNEVNCNPTAIGLGPKPTTNTGYWHVDAFAWMGYPGLSDVPASGCPDPDQSAINGKPYVDPFASPEKYPTGRFVEPYAQLLIKQANYTVSGTVEPSNVRTN